MVASSDRAARAIQADFPSSPPRRGQSAWPAQTSLTGRHSPAPHGKNTTPDGRLLLNPAQELAIWSEIVHSDQHLPTALPSSVRRLASMAMEAHDLICSYAPRLLRDDARAGWDQDAEAFSGWLSEFNKQCQKAASSA